MTPQLIDVHSRYDAAEILYALLKERKPWQAISHSVLPSYEEHARFVRDHPYREWSLIMAQDEALGSIYVTHRNEIGIFIFERHQRKSYGQWALGEAIRRYGSPLVANISPQNTASQRFFENFGFRHVQNTYVFRS